MISDDKQGVIELDGIDPFERAYFSSSAVSKVFDNEGWPLPLSVHMHEIAMDSSWHLPGKDPDPWNGGHHFVEVPDHIKAEKVFDKKEDICVFCGLDDYTEEEKHIRKPNLIIYCEVCNLAVHQACYNLSHVDVESDDFRFFCTNCHAFRDEDSSINVECLICKQRGGVMCPTNIPASSIEQLWLSTFGRINLFQELASRIRVDGAT